MSPVYKERRKGISNGVFRSAKASKDTSNGHCVLENSREAGREPALGANSNTLRYKATKTCNGKQFRNSENKTRAKKKKQIQTESEETSLSFSRKNMCPFSSASVPGTEQQHAVLLIRTKKTTCRARKNLHFGTTSGPSLPPFLSPRVISYSTNKRYPGTTLLIACFLCSPSFW